jgi:hypothetical protein
MVAFVGLPAFLILLTLVSVPLRVLPIWPRPSPGNVELEDSAQAALAPTPSPSGNPVLRALADRGAVVTIFDYTDGRRVSVSFHMGELVRRWRKEHDFPMPLCGMGVELELESPDIGPPMTDSDISLLDRISALSYVDFSGTQVTDAAVRAFRKRRPRVEVVWEQKAR